MPPPLAARRIVPVLAAAALLALAALHGALDGVLPDARAQALFVEEGIAIRGTDPVAYFTEGRPTPGSPDFSAEWGGATWHFASGANRARFLADPEAFAPQYGGFCAWAVSQGYTAPIDPAAWRIVENRLYLNYDRSVQRRWEADIPGHIVRADTNWPGLRGN